MKQVLLLALLLPSIGFSQGEYNSQIGFFIPVEVPITSEMPKMSTGIGLGIQGAYRPMPNFPMFIELKGNLGMYSYQNSQQTYLFGNGASTITDVTFRSSMHKIQLGTKFYVSNFYKPVRGFVTPQVSWNFMRTKISIADPEDTDGCKPYENRVAQQSNGLSFGGEIGVDLDVQKIFTGSESKNSRMYISVGYMRSFNKMEYINIKHMEDHEHGVAHSDNSTDDGRDMTMEFINVLNNATHEHKIAEIYKTKLNFITINIGYIWYF